MLSTPKSSRPVTSATWSLIPVMGLYGSFGVLMVVTYPGCQKWRVARFHEDASGAHHKHAIDPVPRDNLPDAMLAAERWALQLDNNSGAPLHWKGNTALLYTVRDTAAGVQWAVNIPVPVQGDPAPWCDIFIVLADDPERIPERHQHFRLYAGSRAEAISLAQSWRPPSVKEGEDWCQCAEEHGEA